MRMAVDELVGDGIGYIVKRETPFLLCHDALEHYLQKHVAKLFDQDLKNRYDPEGKDKQTERLVQLWEKGEFDLFYYSIFFEWPKKTEIPSEYQ